MADVTAEIGKLGDVVKGDIKLGKAKIPKIVPVVVVVGVIAYLALKSRKTTNNSGKIATETKQESGLGLPDNSAPQDYNTNQGDLNLPLPDIGSGVSLPNLPDIPSLPELPPISFPQLPQIPQLDTSSFYSPIDQYVPTIAPIQSIQPIPQPTNYSSTVNTFNPVKTRAQSSKPVVSSGPKSSYVAPKPTINSRNVGNLFGVLRVTPQPTKTKPPPARTSKYIPPTQKPTYKPPSPVTSRYTPPVQQKVTKITTKPTPKPILKSFSTGKTKSGIRVPY